MKLVNELIKSEKFNFNIPVEGQIEFVVKKDERVKVGDILFKKEYKKVLDSFNIVKEFEIDIKSAQEYITRINGEYITQGEVIAEKISRGGLSIKKIVATYDGILSLDRLSSGFLEILSEHITVEVESKIIGKVIDVDFNSGIDILSNSFVFKNFSTTKIQKNGVFEVLKEGESLYSVRDLAPNYTGKIVYIGRFAYASIVSEIMERGAVAVVVWAMDYTEYELVKDHTVILGGFGQISYDYTIAKYITSMEGAYTTITPSNMYWADIGQTLYKDSNNDIVRNEIKVNDKVRIIDVDNFGRVGKVVDNSEAGFYILKLENDQRVLLPEDTLEVIE